MVDSVIAEIGDRKVSIPIGLKRPFIKDFNTFQEWHADELAYATTLKERLEAGENLPHSIEQEMINWSKQNLITVKNKSKLNNEKRLLYLDMKIKMVLRRDQYNTKQCLELLRQLKRLRFTPLMLKKNPEIIKTVEKITRFRGKGLDHKEVRKIRKYGYRILKKMNVMFNVSDKQSFLQIFKQKESDFFNLNLGLNVISINMMVEDP